MPRTSSFLRQTVVALALAATATSGLVALGTGPAGAAGDAKIDKYVVNFPADGWTPWSTADASAVVAAERKSMKAVTDDKTLIAVKGWESDTGRVFVVLTAVSGGIDGAAQNAKAAVLSTCASAVGESPTNQRSFKAGDAGAEGTCTGTSSSGNEVDATVISFVKGNTIALVVGTGTSAAQIEALAKKQAKALPKAILV